MLRALITELTPPLALRAARRVWRRSRGLGAHTFEGCYPSIEAAPCGPGRYEDDTIAAAIVASTRRELDALDTLAPMIDDSGQLLLPIIVSQFSGPITVLDFGAGPARGLINIRRHAPRIDCSALRYIVVETEAVCRAFAHSGLKVEAVAHIPDALPAPLIINAGSAIQYVSDYRALLQRLTTLAPEYLVVSQTPMSELPTYARVQLNIPHKKIAQWVLNRDEFAALMESFGYIQAFTVDHDLALTHTHAPGPSQMTSMIFRPAVRGENAADNSSRAGAHDLEGVARNWR